MRREPAFQAPGLEQKMIREFTADGERLDVLISRDPALSVERQEEAVKELARLIGGARITENTLNSAREMKESNLQSSMSDCYHPLNFPTFQRLQVAKYPLGAFRSTLNELLLVPIPSYMTKTRYLR